MNVSIEVAGPRDFRWAQRSVAEFHYLRKPVDVRSRPLAYVVRLGPEPVGCLIFGRPEATRCYDGGLTYGSQADVAAGRARLDRWEVLNLARVWLDPRVQSGGPLCLPGDVPGFTDRRGVWRPALASWCVLEAMKRVGHDYLLRHPPVFVEQPYQIRAVLSYCNTNLHRGTLYRAAGFRLARCNGAGIETWWEVVAPLTAAQDAEVRERARKDQRGARIRGRLVPAPSLFGEE